MPWGTFVICIVIGLLFFFAIRHIVKKGTCGGKCEGCSKGHHCGINEDAKTGR